MKPYWALGALVGVPVFLGGWIYCVVTYGFLLGVTVGWIPSAIVGGLAAAVWPLFACGAVWAWLAR